MKNKTTRYIIQCIKEWFIYSLRRNEKCYPYVESIGGNYVV